MYEFVLTENGWVVCWGPLPAGLTPAAAAPVDTTAAGPATTVAAAAEVRQPAGRGEHIGQLSS